MGHRWFITTFSLIIESSSMGNHWIIENPSMGNQWIIENPSMGNHWIIENPSMGNHWIIENPSMGNHWIKLVRKSCQNRSKNVEVGPKIVKNRSEKGQKYIPLSPVDITYIFSFLHFSLNLLS